MQTLGYVIVNKEKILLLARTGQFSRYLSKRESGVDGTHFEDEEAFLSSPRGPRAEQILDDLNAGKTVIL